jgi:retron-type reverse transcriptase
MVMNEKNFDFSWRLLSWEKSMNNLYRVQKRLFKSVCVADFRKALQIQKLILNSNSARLLAIREVTQISATRKIPGIDGKTFLSFTDRFELNELSCGQYRVINVCNLLCYWRTCNYIISMHWI